MRHYPDSALIDRLVLGKPPSDELTRRALRLEEGGELTHREIAELLNTTQDAIAARVERVKRQRRLSPKQSP